MRSEHDPHDGTYGTSEKVPTVTVQPAGVRIRVDDGRSILEGLFQAGYAYRIGCRRGGCGICKIDLLDGTVEYRHTVAETVLSEEERREGTCLSCRAVPQGDVVVALRDETLRQVNRFLARVCRAD